MLVKINSESSATLFNFKGEKVQFKVFLIPTGHSAKLEAEMNTFLRSHKIITVNKEFILNGENSSWAILVEYIEDETVLNEKVRGAIDYKEVLSDEDFSLFSYLREVRKEIASSQGLPIYVILTNAQLAELAQKKPKSLAELGKIQGIGQGKCEKFGQFFLNALTQYKKEK